MSTCKYCQTNVAAIRGVCLTCNAKLSQMDHEYYEEIEQFEPEHVTYDSDLEHDCDYCWDREFCIC